MKKDIIRLVICIIVMHFTSQFSVHGQQNGLWYPGKSNDTVKTNRFVVVNNSETIQGTVKADSLVVKGGAHIKGPLHIGINSLTLQGLGSSTTDDITSDNGVLLLGGSPTFSTISVGIGTTTPLAGMMLDVNGNINTSNATNGYFINDNEVLKYHGASGIANISNIFVGVEAGNSNTAGAANTANGYQALYNNITGGNNTANGYQALYNTVGWSNTAVGFQAYQGAASASGGGNVAIGMQSLFKNNTGNYNIANGVRALYNNITGNYNTANGMSALWINYSGYENTATGSNALFNNYSGYENAANGGQVLS
ncbi:MAG: hypothetical protein WC868_07015 [Bacteroidales bacterium]